MRPIHLARLDESRPVLVLTRELVRPHLTTVTIAPITSTIRGLSTEILCGPDNGLDHQCAVACDHITTIPDASLGRHIGWLTDDQESELTTAIHAAFDLDLP
jgi:mRNA interferase MazF